MRCKFCNGNILQDGKCMQCGRRFDENPPYKKRSCDNRKKLQGRKFPQ